MRVLVVEDERPLAKAIKEILTRNNYSVDVSHDGEEGLWQAESKVHDLIILDIMLPSMDGIEVLTNLREKGIETPVLLLTALGQSKDKVRGLDSGADDYLSKPFHAEELLARLRALLRRQPKLNDDGLLYCGDVCLDPHTLSLSCASESIALSLKESQLLELLIGNQGCVISKSHICDKLWGFETTVAQNAGNRVETHVSLLRRKLKDVGSSTSIKTIRGLGYLLADVSSCTEGD